MRPITGLTHLLDTVGSSDDEHQPLMSSKRRETTEANAEDDLVCYRMERQSNISTQAQSCKAAKIESVQHCGGRARMMGQRISANPKQLNRRLLACRILRLLKKMPTRPNGCEPTIVSAA